MYKVKYSNTHAQYKTWGERFVVQKHLHMGTRGWAGNSEYLVSDRTVIDPSYQRLKRPDQEAPTAHRVGFETLKAAKEYMAKEALGVEDASLVKLVEHEEWKDYK